MTEQPLSPQEIQQAIMSGGFHRYFANPQQAMAWPGIEPLARLIIRSKGLEQTVTALNAELESLKKNGNSTVAPVQGVPSTWDDVPTVAPAPVAEKPVQAPVAPQTQTIQRKGIRIEGVDPIEPPKPKSPYDSATAKRTVGKQNPPSFALPQGSDGSAEGQTENGTQQDGSSNPHYLGSKIPPAPDPQEFVIGSEGSEVPSPPVLDLSKPMPMQPMAQQPLTADEIPPEVLARMNAPFPVQPVNPMSNVPVNMSEKSGNYFDSILGDA